MLETVVEETRKAREALEAKGAFTEQNAATHLILALEALIQYVGYDDTLALRAHFMRGLGNTPGK